MVTFSLTNYLAVLKKDHHIAILDDGDPETFYQRDLETMSPRHDLTNKKTMPKTRTMTKTF